MSEDEGCCEICCAPCVTMKSGGGDCSIIKVLAIIFAIIFILIPNIADLVLNILDYKEDIKNYYIMRFIEQGFLMLYFIIILGQLSISYYNLFSVGSYVTTCLIFAFSIIMAVFEIINLVFYIRNYQNIDFLGKISYYIHFIYYIYIIGFLMILLN